ncbi:plastocyanin/azurin family copper-binding protein [Actimicrobium sp. CCC2.4]|uniref:cupredoxin domain-containing protein n=1 Tax=Actimicrobium sp. CCC2.4 TaxID=3048606 RepID=UPI002AC993ED|nr:plastocyanin/azurin family copper-binding protein [Actimicrobium sp. CCC2.4]MEB0136888.1 plastocyanin/azurin family copper-binding protein [Actimicrobium sp. CCC2.4]WPX33438.1 plastocyanin/azurin family copper-binding protein [Actimicrobium sp. CCC2.4]
MLHPSINILPLLLPLLLVLPAQAKDFTVTQKDKKFSQTKLEVKVGDVVNFKNEDPFAHNIFSLSDIKTFDLGSYPQGQSKSVAFDKPGTVEIECSVHPDMKLIVEVKK